MDKAESLSPALKALRILESLADQPGGRTLSEIAHGTGLNKTTAFRFLQDMVAQGYVRRDESAKTYRPGYRLLGLASAMAEGIELRALARPLLERLVSYTGETVHLVTRDGLEGVYIDKVDCPQPVGLLSRVGKRIPLYCTGVGKVILAFSPPDLLAQVLERGTPRFTQTTLATPEELHREMERIRGRQYALDNGEHREGIACVAGPVFDARGHLAGSVSIAGPSFRFPLQRAEALAPVLLETCKEISAELGYRGTFRAVSNK